MPARSRSAADAARAVTQHPAFAQLVRFVAAGLGVTALAVGIYGTLAVELRVYPMLANAVSQSVGVGAGYLVHSNWSFRGSGERAAATMARFGIVAAVSFSLNSAWVWIATVALHLPAWAPVPMMIFVTPLASFALNRYWVFAARKTA